MWWYLREITQFTKPSPVLCRVRLRWVDVEWIPWWPPAWHRVHGPLSDPPAGSVCLPRSVSWPPPSYQQSVSGWIPVTRRPALHSSAATKTGRKSVKIRKNINYFKLMQSLANSKPYLNLLTYRFSKTIGQISCRVTMF